MSLTFAINILITFVASCSLAFANAFPMFNNKTVFQSPPNYTVPGTLYARTLELPDGSLLATWENYGPEPPLVYFPIYKSIDGAATWHEISHVTDQVNGWGLRYQPFLYLLPEPIGGLPANSILLAGNSIPTNLSNTQIDLYSSTDNGCTWKFISHIAAGGAAIPDNGVPAVWEPFLLFYQSELICFYSDQRDPQYGQKLVHQNTSDLVSWSAPINDVTYPNYTDRPGMAVVAKLPAEQWILTYENGGAPIPGVPAANYSFPAYYRISDSPLTFNSAEDLPISTPDGTHPQGSPYCVWSPVGGPNGSIIVSTGTHSEVFVNQAVGDVAAWEKLATEERVSYSRSLRLDHGGQRLLIAGGGLLPPSKNNSVTVGSIDLGEALGSATWR
jgi:hypothetical protein